LPDRQAEYKDVSPVVVVGLNLSLEDYWRVTLVLWTTLMGFVREEGVLGNAEKPYHRERNDDKPAKEND
jgi:hypothetical protein